MGRSKSFSALPQELLIMILQQLPEEQDLRDLLNLRLVSKAWREAFAYLTGSCQINLAGSEARVGLIGRILPKLSAISIVSEGYKIDLDISLLSSCGELTCLCLQGVFKHWRYPKLDGLSSLPATLKTLSINAFELPHRGFCARGFHNLSNVSRVELCHGGSMANGVKAIKFLQQLPGLQELSIGRSNAYESFPYFPLTSSFADNMSGLTQMLLLGIHTSEFFIPPCLRELHVHTLYWEPGWMPALIHSSSLTKLKLSSCSVSKDMQAEHISPSTALRSLELIDSAGDFMRLGHCNLQSLNLEARHIYQRTRRLDDQLTSGLKSLTGLTSLRLSHITAPPNAEQMHFPKLSELEISCCRNWEALFGLSNLAQLSRLEVEKFPPAYTYLEYRFG